MQPAAKGISLVPPLNGHLHHMNCKSNVPYARVNCRCGFHSLREIQGIHEKCSFPHWQTHCIPIREGDQMVLLCVRSATTL